MSPAEESLLVIAQTSNKTLDMANKNLIVKDLYLYLCILTVYVWRKKSHMGKNLQEALNVLFCICGAYRKHIANMQNLLWHYRRESVWKENYRQRRNIFTFWTFLDAKSQTGSFLCSNLTSKNNHKSVRFHPNTTLLV